MAERKDQFAVISRFEKIAKQKAVVLGPINRHTERWAAEALIDSYGLSEVYELIQYYFDTVQKPSWKHFTYSADRIFLAKQNAEADKALRAKMRQKMKEWMNES